MNKDKLINLVKRTLKIYSDQEGGVYAGYSTLFIMTAAFPMLMLLIAAVNMMPDFSTEDITALMIELLPDLKEIQSLFLQILNNLKGQTSGLLASVSALTSLWSASSGISAIQKGLKKTFKEDKSKFDKPLALVYTLLFIVLIIAVLVFQLLGSSITSILSSLPKAWGLADIAAKIISFVKSAGFITAAVMFLVILLTYTYLPGGKRTIKSQIPGSLLCSLGWIISSALFAFFIPRFWNKSGIYGSLASIFLIIMWLKIIFSILFVGSSLNEAIAELKSEEAE